MQKEENLQMEEDLEDQEIRLNEEKKLLEEIEFKKRSSVLKEGLPRPIVIN